MNLKKFKQNCAAVFDDNLHTKVWHNLADYIIISLIVISTIEVFLSTFDSIMEQYSTIMNVVSVVITIIFTIEVCLRIWCADLLNPKYKGFWGRVRYCFSFYGLIDILATFPFYVSFFFPINYTMLKTLRVVRLTKVFRYMKSFRLLSNAFASKKGELLVSMQFLLVITLILSFVLYFTEHEAQPDKYTDGIVSVVWAFMQYIGDPGNFAENEPVTLAGRIVACVIGILGIAIFAVPAGLIGAGFTEAMEKEQKAEKTCQNITKLRLAFERKMDRPTRFQVSPQYVSIVDVQARLRMSLNDIFDAIDHSDHFRLVNLAATQPVATNPDDKLAVEHFHINTSYGCCINRNSNVTIVSPASLVDPCFYHFAYYCAKIGGFNFISRELGELRPYKSFYLLPDGYENVPNCQAYLNDIETITAQSKHPCVITLLAASGALEPAYLTQLHFTYGGKQGDESYDGEKLTIHDIPQFDAMYKELSQALETDFELKSDRQRYHNTASPKLFTRHLKNVDNIEAFVIRVAWSAALWDPKHVQISQTMAQYFAKHYDGGRELTPSEELTRKDIGYDDYVE